MNLSETFNGLAKKILTHGLIFLTVEVFLHAYGMQGLTVLMKNLMDTVELHDTFAAMGDGLTSWALSLGGHVADSASVVVNEIGVDACCEIPESLKKPAVSLPALPIGPAPAP